MLRKAELKTLTNLQAETAYINQKINAVKKSLSDPTNTPELTAHYSELIAMYQERLHTISEQIKAGYALIQTLPLLEQRIATLRYIEGYTWQQTAKKMDYSESYCRKRLAAYLEQ